MSTRASVIEDGIDRIQAAFRSAEEEVGRIQKQVEKRTTQFNKETEKRVKRFRKDLRKNEAIQQAQSRWDDVSKGFQKRRKEFEGQVETGLASVLGTFQIASSSDLKKLDKKLNRISRRLNALDKTLGAQDKAATK
ncbi:phasin family protein [Myxococcota bacterium]|nr:phasin family protein [Myxococcota bacterium]